MGSSSSKPSFQERVKATVEEEVARKMMQQRELNMSLNIAKARDALQIFGSIYLTGVSGITVAKLAGKPVPHVAMVPVLVGGIVLGNMADMAYGNKLQRGRLHGNQHGVVHVVSCTNPISVTLVVTQ